MAKIVTANFETTAFQLSPFEPSPDVTEVIQQALSRLVGWDSEAQQWRFVRVNDSGDLFATVGPEQSASLNESVFTVTTTAQIVLAVNASRKKVVFYNNGTQTVYLGGTSGTSSSTGLPLGPGASYTEDIFNGAFYGITSTSTSDLRILEYT